MLELGGAVVVFACPSAVVITVTDVLGVPARARLIMRGAVNGVGQPCVMRRPSAKRHRRCSKGLQWQRRQ